jgi:hypothetical protein
MRAKSHIEQYEFECQPCNYGWLMTYEVRPAENSQSAVPDFFYLNGIPATPPDAGRLCPNCWTPSYSGRKLDEAVLVRARS